MKAFVMDLDQIGAFVAISRLKSFSRAADALHRLQPAISRRIDLLNQELGAPLFERVKGAVTLRRYGSGALALRRGRSCRRANHLFNSSAGPLPPPAWTSRRS